MPNRKEERPDDREAERKATGEEAPRRSSVAGDDVGALAAQIGEDPGTLEPLEPEDE